METKIVNITLGANSNELESTGNNLFSVYKKPITNLIPHKEVITLDIYRLIVSDKYKSVTEKLRSSNVAAKEIKASEFDYATFSGTFAKRTNASLKQHSGLICIDLDHLKEIEYIKESVLKDFIPELMFISPSGDGLKLVYRIDVSEGNHLEYFKALQRYFKLQLNITIDSSGKDVSRACFLPHDPDCHYTDTPTVLNRSFLDTFIEDVPDSRENGILQLTDTNEIYSRVKLWVDKTETFAKGNRNKYITKFAAALNRYGVPENFVLSELEKFKEDDFTKQEIENTVKSLYRKSTIFNTAKFEATNYEMAAEPQKTKQEVVETIPLLPIDGLPDFLQKLITECAQTYGTHRDFWAGSFLAATALAIGQSHELKGKYSNATVLWLAIVAPSGVGKTEPLNFAFKPFHKMDGAAITDHERLFSEYEAAKAMGKEERKEAGYNGKQAMPVCKQYILSDATPEAVISANKNNERGINILRDELHGWLLDFGRYSKSGEVQNWLSSWSQQPMTVNRKGASPVKNQHPFINITGGLQPDIIPELAKDFRAVNGFMQRFCFVYPDEVVRPEYRSNEISESLKQQYNEYINNLLSLTGHCESVYLSNEAQSIYETFVNQNTKIINTEKADYLRALYAKLDVISLRFALIIHFSKWGCSGIDEPNINPETMKSAINITEYFRATGRKIFKKLNSVHSGIDKKSVAKYLESLGNSQPNIASILKVSQPYINKILKN